jgi:glutamate synthase domain-containing protein 2|tara:strand:- start:20948 stop:22189 length:1242 start_codon:yes stop_codon:yes gene_type:complete
VYRKAKDIDSAASFGSLHNFDAEEIKVRHSMFPSSKADLKPFRVTVGEERGLKSAYTIIRPIMISAMSYGALGSNAVRALAREARLASIPMNTGEGGFPKYHLMEGCDLIFQLGTEKFGVRNEDGTLHEEKLRELTAKPEIKMIEIKLSQGAKPGKGGLLPKEKISDEIAELRGVSKDKDVVSPPHHAECKDLSTTVSFIKHVQEVGGLPTGIKLCVGSLNEFKALIGEMKRQDVFPDYISIDGSEGGTGAAPRAFLDRVGMPLLPALCGVQHILIEEGVRKRVKLFAAGKLIDPSSQILAFALGADVIYSARGFMLSLGCIQAMQCGNNTCPVGITTHDPSLTRGLVIGEKAVRIKNYVEHIEHDLVELLAATGKRSLHELTLDNLYVPSQSSLAGMVREDPFFKPEISAVV